MSYQLTLSDNAYNIIKLVMETRLNHYNQNISVYVERAIEYEEIIKELATAEHVKDPKPVTVAKKKEPPKPVAANLCKDHPNYGAKRRPRSECEACWQAFEKYNGKDATARARRDYNRKLDTNGKATKSVRR